MHDTFTLSLTQLQSARENGLICDHYGPIEGTQDIYEIKPFSLQNMVAAFIKMGKVIGAGGRVVNMFSSKQKRTAHA